jgi:glutaredoxin
MSSEIILFTLNGCFHCVSLKKKLEEETISFTEIEVTKNQNLWDKVVEQTGHNVLPTVFVKKENTDIGPIFIPGKDFEKPDDLILKLKKHIIK